ncbi:putative negative regulator of RcsB-dependent stress response [Desulfobaculum xiamenense]|uniref:Putative negative regulator of RcsB-dependent stress response n=1 Tax=Desulfobaculum xiamenense TaxID=995050 RepID=A0A846QK27_9BACT|nr:tetratricopeptide repeat protein [Desulfobaculum xiamenense]NJB67410.1 putative negative regulator of RcsB-dependent stress response [Desulfobaculum xiamenense]
MTDTASAPNQGAPVEELLENVPSKLHPVLQAIVDNIRFILAGIALLVIAVGASAVYKHVQASAVEKARTEIGEALAKAPAERVAALDALAASAPEELRAAIALELAGALSEAGDHDRAAAELGKIVASGNAVGPMAALGQAAELSRAGKNAEALAVLESASANAPAAFAPVFARQTAVLAEATGDLARARAAYEKLLEAATAGNKGYIEDKIARLEAQIAKNS